MSVSVCIATYNGGEFVVKQLTSILDELGPTDEVVVVDDASTDETVRKVKSLQDSRIKLFQNPENKREIYSFSYALSKAKNDIVFLSDQDDIWLPGRVALMKDALINSEAEVLTSNFRWIDQFDNPVDVPFDGVSSKTSSEGFRNILDIFVGRTNYFGCAMAIRKRFLKIICPIPEYVESHDLWIALSSNLLKANLHIDDETFLKRRHSSNATSTESSRPFLQKLWSRVVFARSLVAIYLRSRSHNRIHEASSEE